MASSSGQTALGPAEQACGTPGSTSGVFFPDLRRDEHFIDMSIMVKILMRDLVFVMCTIGFFVAAIVYVWGCDRLK